MKEIYHIPLAPWSGNPKAYRATKAFYEADADNLKDYVTALLLELNDGDGGAWRGLRADEITVYGLPTTQAFVVRGDYPDAEPILVAFISKEKESANNGERK